MAHVHRKHRAAEVDCDGGELIAPMPPSPPLTHEANPFQMAENLDGAELAILAVAFRTWALSDLDLRPLARTALMLASADFERIVIWVGPDWKATNPIYPPTVLKYLAGMLLREGIRPMDRLLRWNEWRWGAPRVFQDILEAGSKDAGDAR
jgi:hypothetical protein